MKLLVSKIPEDGTEEELTVRVSLSDENHEDEARVRFRASRYGERVLIEGRASLTTALECSRCLKQFSYPVDTEFQVEYIPRGKEPDEADERELSADELDVSLYSQDEIDIDSMVREQLMIAIPMKPLCDPQCGGICPRCGKNLNEESCDCPQDTIDPRMEPLKRLKMRR